jgi:hypothetical protein
MHILIGERTGRTDLSALRAAHYPLEVTARNRLTIRLSLPEAGLRLDPLGDQSVTFGSFDLLQRTVSSLEQLAAIQRAPELVDLNVPAVGSEPTPEPAPEPAPEPEPIDAEPIAVVISESGDTLTVELDGVQFDIQRNQRRADGSLTPRAKRIFEQAKAAVEAKS